MDTLLRTIHGSHLYGLSRAESDEDWFVVIPTDRGKRKRNANQTIINGIDTTVMDMSTFMASCEKGVPQCLEALFSPVPEVDNIAEFRHNWTVNLPGAVETYRRTVKSFALEGGLKRRRHALRLAYNLNHLMEHGRFNPTLNQYVVNYINAVSNSDDVSYFRQLSLWGHEFN